MTLRSTAICRTPAGPSITGPGWPAQAQEKVLRAVMHADVRTLDPYWTTQTIAGIHGMMIYDTLFSSDDKLEPKPQMVDTWTVSPDGKRVVFCRSAAGDGWSSQWSNHSKPSS